MRFALMVASVVLPLSMLTACEDSPPEIFTPNKGNTTLQNGYSPQAPWFQDGRKVFDTTAGAGDSTGRARQCDEREVTALFERMAHEPIIPNVGLGGIPLWIDGGVTNANSLTGRPEAGKFCDPTVYSDTVIYWGPGGEIYADIDAETRLLNSLIAGPGYQGTLEGRFTQPDGGSSEASLAIFTRISVAGVKLTDYVGSAEQATKPNSWLNHDRVNQLSQMLRETFFGAPPEAARRDCFAAKLCEVIYTSADESTPQETLLKFTDSGLVLQLAQDGTLLYAILDPVRIAPFQASATFTLLDGSNKLAPSLSSTSVAGCTLELSGKTWQDFQTQCVAPGDALTLNDPLTLDLAKFNHSLSRDVAYVAFEGMELSYLRRPVTKPTLLRDGDKPVGTDALYGMTLTRTFNTPVAQFVPAALAADYRARLEARVHALVAASPGHPFETYTAPLAPASLEATAARLTGLPYVDGDGAPRDFVVDTAKALVTSYGALTVPQKEAAKAVLHSTFAVEPFVEAVLAAFSGGASDATATNGGFRALTTTHDGQWSIGFLHFRQDGVPVRLVVQYSLFFDALTALTVERGGASQLDDLFDAELADQGGLTTYYSVSYARFTDDRGAPLPLSLGGAGISITGVDRVLGTLDVVVDRDIPGEGAAPLAVTVPGTSVVDRGGFSKQTGGERFEFVPAHAVVLSGTETTLTYYVTEKAVASCAGEAPCSEFAIAAVSQARFKNPQRLCSGLSIPYGADIVAAVDAWARTRTVEQVRACELVYNYSTNGNVLTGVASIAGSTAFSVTGGRATGVLVWKN